jgi:hypothetical protein
MHFPCPLNRDAHKSRYPEHFNQTLPQKPVQEDAQPQIYMTKRKRRKPDKEEDEVEA